MVSSTDPLRENEVGTFGELSRRPNPDNLVILPVPPVEDFLASLRQQLGRDLTPQDIEIQRRKSPSIVVNKSVAERMLAERAARPPAAITEPVVRPPTLTSTYNDMPTEPADRKETAIEVFGQHLFSLRNQLVERLRRTIESDEIRNTVGKLHRKEYDGVAALAPEGREAALALARKTIDLYMQYILMLLTGTGDSDRFGDDHAVNYRLVLEVKEVATDKIVEQFDINRKSKKVFYDYYGRWLNRFGSHK